jgi:hypothetical protein
MSELKRHIFISYSHADAAIAAAIAESLNRAGVGVFIDKIALMAGDSLTERLEEGLNQAVGLVTIISSNSISSTWVKRELNAVRDSGIRVVPFKLDDCEWTTQLRLLLGDPLYLVGAKVHVAAGQVPKLFPEFRSSPGGDDETFFPLSESRDNSPCTKFFNGTLQTAIEECAFGHVAVVIPTDQAINLGGKVTSSVLSYLGISLDQVSSSKSSISSRNVSVIAYNSGDAENLLLLASTVFNSTGSPCAEDQWRSAKAVLDFCESNSATVVLVPPLGTGVFGWPVRQAIVNWFYGAIRWVRQRTMVTSTSVWPILCVPGPGDQKICSCYFRGLSAERLRTLEERRLTLKLRWQGQESNWLSVREDVLLGSIGRNVIPKFECRTFFHGAGLINRRTLVRFEYGPDTPLSKTIFADGDVIVAE